MKPQQYWDYELPRTMGKVFGTPIGIDKRNMERVYSYFVNVLVDIDVSKPVPLSFNVREEGGKQFQQNVEILKLLAFYSHCKIMRHEITQCRKLKRVLQSVEAQPSPMDKDGFTVVTLRGKERQPQQGNSGGGGDDNSQRVDIVNA